LTRSLMGILSLAPGSGLLFDAIQVDLAIEDG